MRMAANWRRSCARPFSLSGRDDLSYVFQEPFGFKDWNDQLTEQATRSPSLRPAARSLLSRDDDGAFMNRPRDFDLLTLADVARLLHCSKAHVSHVIAGRVPGCPPIPAVSSRPP